MPEDTIKARIVFDDASFRKATSAFGIKGEGKGAPGTGGGFAEAFARTTFAQDFPIWGDILAGLGGLVLAVRALVDVVKWGFGKLVEASPHLQATMSLIAKIINITLRPIADTVSMFLRPLAIAWLRVVLPVYKAWRTWFGEGGGAEARIEIGEGFKEVIAGLIGLDFERMFEGFGRIFDGVVHLFSSFADEVIGPQIKKVYDFWKAAQEQFQTSGIFDTMGAIIKDVFLEGIEFLMERVGMIGESTEIESFGQAIGIVLKGAWDSLTDKIKNINWEETLGPLYPAFKVIWDWFGAYLENLGEVWWLGPLAPFAAAVKTTWDTIVGPMVDSLIEKLDEKLPGFKQAIDAIFGETEENEDEGIFGRMWSVSKNFLIWLADTFVPGFKKLRIAGEEAFGKTESDRGNTLIGSVNKTSDALKKSDKKVGMLITSLNNIPRNITTIHTIITKRRTVSE